MMVIVQKCPGGSRNRMCEQSEQILHKNDLYSLYIIFDSWQQILAKKRYHLCYQTVHF